MRHLLIAVGSIGLVVAVAAFLNNRSPRDTIGEFLKTKDLKIPERMTGYGASDLQRVTDELGSQRTADGRTLLEMYVRPVLLWNDIIFAIGLAIFAAALWLWVVSQFGLSGWARRLAIAAAVSAALYGIADVAEDLTLVRLFRRPDTIANDAWFACQLTRLKFVTITGSVAGVLVFLTLNWLTTEPTKSGN
jgi:hypothetical protein